MEDTAHLVAGAETDPNLQIAQAADAFKNFGKPPEKPRDEQGRFASANPVEEAETEDYNTDVENSVDDDAEMADSEQIEDEHEAAEEAQPMPPSWPADQAEQWERLPAETQSFLTAREAERERAVNAKFQESANAKREAQLAAQEAQNRRNELIEAFETVEALYSSPEPDPRAFGYGTPQFNDAAYYAARQQWQETSGAIAQLKEQREAMLGQQQAEEARAFSEWKQEHEAQFAPKLLADIPDLREVTKAEPILREIVSYAIANGIPESVFEESMQDQITSAQLHLLWKASQYDKLRANKQVPAKPKPAGPAVKPGVATTRSSQKAVRQKRDFDRLDREGSIEAGAAIFKNFM